MKLAKSGGYLAPAAHASLIAFHGQRADPLGHMDPHLVAVLLSYRQGLGPTLLLRRHSTGSPATASSPNVSTAQMIDARWSAASPLPSSTGSPSFKVARKRRR
jgi:hypothetical protein